MVLSLPSSSGVISMSRKGMELSSLVSSCVKWMLSSIEFMCSRKASFCVPWMMVKVSSTNLFQSVGGRCCGQGFGFKIFHKQICHYRAYRRPHSSSFDLLIHLSLEGKIGGSKAKFKQTGDLFHCHGCSLVQIFVFLQVLLDDGNCWFYRHWCK